MHKVEEFSPHLAENIGHLLSLLLGPLVGTQLPLGDLKSTLVLPDLQKLSDPLLIWSKPSNFPDQVPHKVDPLARFLQNPQSIAITISFIQVPKQTEPSK